MEKSARITNIALCVYRESLEVKFAEQMAIAKKLNKDNGAYDEDGYAIAMHKALTAAIECHDVNDMLGSPQFVSNVWDRDLVDKMFPMFEERAATAYERAEARVEDLALADFHHNAYGDD